MIASVQHLRFAAALSVLLFHAASYAEASKPAWISLFFDRFWGMTGVTTFFVLSGFLMSRIYGKSSAPDFLLSRMARIYPAFILAVLAVVGVQQIVGTGKPFDPATLLLLPLGTTAGFALDVEWALIYAVMFSAILAACRTFVTRRRMAQIAAGWAILVLALSVTGFVDTSPSTVGWQILISPYLAAFAIGYFAQTTFLDRTSAIGWGSFAGVFVVSFLARDLWLASSVATSVWVILFSTAVALLLVRLEQMSEASHVPAEHWKRGFLDRAGDASYVVYLVHIPVCLLAASFLAPAGTITVFAVSVIVSLALALPLGALDVGLYRRLATALRAMPTLAKRLIFISSLSAYALIAIWASSVDMARAWSQRPLLAALERQVLAPLRGVQQSGSPQGLSLVHKPEDVMGFFGNLRLDGGMLTLQGWGARRGQPEQPVQIVLSVNDRIVASAQPFGTYGGVGAFFGDGRFDHANVFFSFSAPVRCGVGARISVYAVSPDGAIARLQPIGEQMIVCPEPNALVRLFFGN